MNVQLVETGVGETQVLEQDLRTGEENWLNHYLKLQGSCADAEAEYWRWLYQYNRQQGGTIHVAGLGTERNTVVSMYALLWLWQIRRSNRQRALRTLCRPCGMRI